MPKFTANAPGVRLVLAGFAALWAWGGKRRAKRQAEKIAEAKPQEQREDKRS